MCTLAILKTSKKIIVTMNRDEHRLRHESNKITIKKNPDKSNSSAFPTDLKTAGTWFGINDSGVVLALLNRYQNPLIENPISRGEIIPKALSQGSLNAVFDYCGTLVVENYNPFDLILISKSQGYRFKWNGSKYKIIPINLNQEFFITSSSVDREAVLKWRKKYFKNWISQQVINDLNEAQILTGINLQQDDMDKSRSIYMSREQSHTKSISQVSLSSASVDYQYFPESDLMDLNLGSSIHHSFQLASQALSAR